MPKKKTVPRRTNILHGQGNKRGAQTSVQLVLPEPGSDFTCLNLVISLQTASGCTGACAPAATTFWPIFEEAAKPTPPFILFFLTAPLASRGGVPHEIGSLPLSDKYNVTLYVDTESAYAKSLPSIPCSVATPERAGSANKGSTTASETSSNWSSSPFRSTYFNTAAASNARSLFLLQQIAVVGEYTHSGTVSNAEEWATREREREPVPDSFNCNIALSSEDLIFHEQGSFGEWQSLRKTSTGPSAIGCSNVNAVIQFLKILTRPRVKHLVAHNLVHDWKVLRQSCKKVLGGSTAPTLWLPDLPPSVTCTMLLAQSLKGTMAGLSGVKNFKLETLHQTLTESNRPQLHLALPDAVLCKEVYTELRNHLKSVVPQQKDQQCGRPAEQALTGCFLCGADDHFVNKCTQE